jgi:hypothetical protein
MELVAGQAAPDPEIGPGAAGLQSFSARKRRGQTGVIAEDFRWGLTITAKSVYKSGGAISRPTVSAIVLVHSNKKGVGIAYGSRST